MGFLHLNAIDYSVYESSFPVSEIHIDLIHDIHDLFKQAILLE